MRSTAQGKERGADLCRHLDGPSIGAAVVAAFFEALQPAEIDLPDAVLSAQEAERVAGSSVGITGVAATRAQLHDLGRHLPTL